jgi:hypothetical protein
MSLSPKYQKYADRLAELVEEGKQVARLDRRDPQSGMSMIRDQDKISLYAWLIKSKNIIRRAFGEKSIHYEQITGLSESVISNDYEVYRIVGVLDGALDDLRNGFLITQEFLVAGDIFDSLLDQAKHLTNTGYKDPAAVLVRVVVEDSLQRIARETNVDPGQKASRLNDELRKVERYAKPQWRVIQSWLDIGNAAAHGDFEDYEASNVNSMIQEVERFLADQFHS